MAARPAEYKWPERRSTSATRKPFEHTNTAKAPWSFYAAWDRKRPDMYQATSQADFQRFDPQPKIRKPEFTMPALVPGEEEGRGVKIGLDDFLRRETPYVVGVDDAKARLRSQSSLAYTKPDLLGAKLEPRAGAIRNATLPPGFSRTSDGLLPGKTDRHAALEADSTYRADMRRYQPQPARTAPSFTLNWAAQVGANAYSVVVPISELNKTHFQVGLETLDYQTSTRAAHSAQPPGSGQQALGPFGAVAEPENKGTEFNIVHGGAPYKPSIYYEPSLPAQMRNSFRPDPMPPRGHRYNTITGELQSW